MMHIGDRKPKVYLYGRNRVARIVILVSYVCKLQNAESSKIIFKDLRSED